MGGGGTVVRVLLMLLLSVVEGRHIGNIYIYMRQPDMKRDNSMSVKVEEDTTSTLDGLMEDQNR